MQPLLPVLTAFALLIPALPSSAQPSCLPTPPLPGHPLSIAVEAEGAGPVRIELSRGRDKITVGARNHPPDALVQPAAGAGILVDPSASAQDPGRSWIVGPPRQPVLVPLLPRGRGPGDLYVNRLSFPNGLSAFFSTASGGIGLRIGYDRRLSPVLRFTGGVEFLTYGYHQAHARLGANLPVDIIRVSLVSFPVGLQRQFAAGKRLIPRIGLGVGPILRFDHHPPPPGFYPSTSLRVDTEFGSLTLGSPYPYRATGIGIGIGLNEGFPQLSLTLGGFVDAGLDIRLGENKDFALSLSGRYALARFTDILGHPGDFGGPSLAVGFGKYF